MRCDDMCACRVGQNTSILDDRAECAGFRALGTKSTWGGRGGGGGRTAGVLHFLFVCAKTAFFYTYIRYKKKMAARRPSFFLN